MKKLLLILLCSVALVLVAGCGGEADDSMDNAKEAMSDAVDSAKEATGEAAEAAGEAMDDTAEAAGDAYDEAVEGAEDQLEAWKKTLAEKEAELQELKAEVEGLSVQDLASQKGKDLKNRYEKLKKEVQELREKIGV